MVYFAVVHLFFCDHFATCRLKNIFSVAFFSSQRMPHILPSVNPPGSAFGMAGRIFYAFFHPPPPRKARSQPKRRDSPCVAVAWWSWPDEPAALNTPQAKRILLREAQRPGKAKKPLSGNSTAYLQNVNLYAPNVKVMLPERVLVVNRRARLLFFVLFPGAGRSKKWKLSCHEETFTARFYHSSFWKSPSAWEQKLCTRFCAITHRKKTTAGRLTPPLRQSCRAASAA